MGRLKTTSKVFIDPESSGAAYIVGLPRSRSCWLASLVNSHSIEGDIMAYHELCRQVTSREQYHETMNVPPCNVELIVDCSSMIQPSLEDKVVIIHRPICDVVESLLKLPMFKDATYDMLRPLVCKAYEELKGLALHTKIKAVGKLLELSYRDLASMSKCEQLLEHIGIVPDREIILSCQELNIQAQYMNEYTLEEFEDLGNRVNSMFDIQAHRSMHMQGTDSINPVKH